ncbi:MAG: cell division protein FtsQ/DivIB, partial [Lysobacteraceae bacterium]
RADLRYTNGFALSWSTTKPAVPEAPASAPAASGGASRTQAST